MIDQDGLNPESVRYGSPTASISHAPDRGMFVKFNCVEVFVAAHEIEKGHAHDMNTNSSAGIAANALSRAAAEPQLAANQQTGLRLACNMCKHKSLRSWLHSNSSSVLDRFGPCCSSTNKSVRLAFATLLINLAVLSGSGSNNDDVQAQVSLALPLSSALHC